MYVVMGATGHIGSVIVDALVAREHAVLGLIHSPDKAVDLEAKGVKSLVIDACDADALRDAFRLGRRAFLLNPPAARRLTRTGRKLPLRAPSSGRWTVRGSKKSSRHPRWALRRGKR